MERPDWPRRRKRRRIFLLLNILLLHHSSGGGKSSTSYLTIIPSSDILAGTDGELMGKPKTTALTREAAWKAKQMYEEKDERGRRRWTIVAIADFLGVGETTAYRAIKAQGPYQSLPEVLPPEKLDEEIAASQARLLSRLAADPPPGYQPPEPPAGSALQRMQQEIKKRSSDGMLAELSEDARERAKILLGEDFDGTNDTKQD
jgi:hypothetical protein